jgi:hypothetical protein
MRSDCSLDKARHAGITSHTCHEKVSHADLLPSQTYHGKVRHAELLSSQTGHETVHHAKLSSPTCYDDTEMMMPSIEETLAVAQPLALPSQEVRRAKKQFSVSTLVPRRTEDVNLTSLAINHRMTSEQLESVSKEMKSFESLNVNLHSQTMKLEDCMQSLVSVETKDYVPLFPTRRLSEHSNSKASNASKEKRLASVSSKSLQSKASGNTPSQSKSKSSLPDQPNEAKLNASPDEAEELAFPIKEFTIPASQEENVKRKKSNSSKGDEKHKIVRPGDNDAKLLSGHRDASSKSSKNSDEKTPEECTVKSQGTLPTQAISQPGDSVKQHSIANSLGCSSASTDRDSDGDFTSAFERFASQERSYQEQVDSLASPERKCVTGLRQYWEEVYKPMPEHVYLLVARYCQFDARKAKKMLSSLNERYLDLTAAQLEPQLMTQVRLEDYPETQASVARLAESNSFVPRSNPGFVPCPWAQDCKWP